MQMLHRDGMTRVEWFEEDVLPTMKRLLHRQDEPELRKAIRNWPGVEDCLRQLKTFLDNPELMVC